MSLLRLSNEANASPSRVLLSSASSLRSTILAGSASESCRKYIGAIGVPSSSSSGVASKRHASWKISFCFRIVMQIVAFCVRDRFRAVV